MKPLPYLEMDADQQRAVVRILRALKDDAKALQAAELIAAGAPITLHHDAAAARLDYAELHALRLTKTGDVKLLSGEDQAAVANHFRRASAKLNAAASRIDVGEAPKAASVIVENFPAPKAKRTRVTKHDAKGRILEFVQEDI